MKDDKIVQTSANNFVDTLRDIIRQETQKLDSTILCRVVSKNNDGTYNLYVEPDEQTVINNIPSVIATDLNQQDYVYVYKIKNQLNNSFIINKVGNNRLTTLSQVIADFNEKLENMELDFQNALKNLENNITIPSGGGSSGGGGSSTEVEVTTDPSDPHMIIFKNIEK